MSSAWWFFFSYFDSFGVTRIFKSKSAIDMQIINVYSQLAYEHTRQRDFSNEIYFNLCDHLLRCLLYCCSLDSWIYVYVWLLRLSFCIISFSLVESVELLTQCWCWIVSMVVNCCAHKNDFHYDSLRKSAEAADRCQWLRFFNVMRPFCFIPN